MMDTITKSNWQVRIAAVIIFVLGFAAGSLAFNTYQRWTHGGLGNRGDHFEQMLDRLHLSTEQRDQVHQIFSDTREQLQALRRESEPKYSEIRRQTDERLQKVLTPEQWQQFQKMREDMPRRGRWGKDDDNRR